MSIVLENVSFDYVEKEMRFRALHEVNLRIGDGEFVAIIGPSGSGKTTLMNIVGLLARPTEGVVLVDGVDTSHQGEASRSRLRNEYLGFVFQRFELFGRHSALENVMEPLTYRSGISPRQVARDRARARRLLAHLGLGDKLDNRPGELSGGQKQRVAIARALVTEPRLILADEPTGALDSHTSQEVLEMLESLNAAGHTVVVVTHSPQVASHAKRIISIHDGRIASDEINVSRARPSAAAAGFFPSEGDHTAEVSRFRTLAWRWGQPLRASLANMRRNSVRSLLTSLGLLIGIFALVVFTGIGGFVEASLGASLSKPGSQIIRVEYNWWRSRQKGLDPQWPGVSLGTPWDALVREFASRGELMPQFDARGCALSGISGRPVRQALETVSSPLEVSSKFLAVQGRLLTRGDFVGRSGAALVNGAMVESLFAKDDPARRMPGFPIGALVRAEECANGLTLRIVGVVKAVGGESFDRKVILTPFDTFSPASVTPIRLSEFLLVPHDRAEVPRLISELEKRFTSRFNVVFDVRSPLTEGKRMLGMLNAFRYTVSVLGLLALFVGGIGVLNIMVVTVAERVREIGVMKSLGATPSTIRNRFLLESSALCLAAALAGLVLGTVTNLIITYVASSKWDSFEFSWGILWAPQVLGVGLFAGLACGLVFGYFPARRAGMLDPVECLRTR